MNKLTLIVNHSSWIEHTTKAILRNRWINDHQPQLYLENIFHVEGDYSQAIVRHWQQNIHEKKHLACIKQMLFLIPSKILLTWLAQGWTAGDLSNIPDYQTIPILT
jgi:hypothetical protein